MTDILLVHPVFLTQNQAEQELMTPYFPLGLLYLAAFLRERGFSVEIFDGTFQNDLEDFQAVLQTQTPNWVGISAVQPNRYTALQLAKMAKTSGASVILGGPDPTVAPERYLADPCVDLVVHHEGEITLAELLERFPDGMPDSGALDDFAGVALRTNVGEIRVNPRRRYILNLDELPDPARDLVDMNRYLETWRRHNGYASMTISVSRGCPYGCRWCRESVHGDSLRLRSPQSVAQEVKSLLQRYRIDRLRLVDDVDGLDREWLEAWETAAQEIDAVLPFEALNDLERRDIPMLDVRDSL
jgi:radical SAM superfamily enzyme YgiQ (UPF0313 family)